MGDIIDTEVQATHEDPVFSAEEFDFSAAKDRQLVALTSSDGTVIGTAIPQYSGNRFNVVIKGEKYTFDSDGNPISQNAADYNLKMAASNFYPQESVVGSTTRSVTRSVDENGDVTYGPSTLDKTYQITVDNLNARDQFAIQALRGMLEKVPNPDEIGKNEITHYCEAAYLWAGYMMQESSKARSVIKDADASDNTKSEEVGYLETNTEKLLNNIVAALDKTNAKIITEGVEHTAERVTIPEVNTKLDTLITSVSAIKTSLDNHTTALNSIKASLDAQTTALNAIATAIGNLELSPVINNNITIPPIPTEE